MTLKNRATRRRFVQGTTATAIAPFFIGRAKADEPEHVMKIATVAPPGTPWAQQLRKIKKYLKKEQLRDYLRVLSTKPDTYELKYFTLEDKTAEEEED